MDDGRTKTNTEDGNMTSTNETTIVDLYTMSDDEFSAELATLTDEWAAGSDRLQLGIERYTPAPPVDLDIYRDRVWILRDAVKPFTAPPTPKPVYQDLSSFYAANDHSEY